MLVTFNVDELLNIGTTKYSPEMTVSLDMDESLSRAAVKVILEKLWDQHDHQRGREFISELAREYLDDDDLAELQIPA